MTVMWLCETTHEPIPVDECLACSRSGARPECPFTPALLKALRAALEDDPALAAIRQIGIPVIRVTDLVGCARRAWYRQARNEPLEPPSKHWARLRGVIFHESLARMGEGIVERRVAVSLERYGLRAVVTGRVDGYDPSTRTLTDYKTIHTIHTRNGLALPLPHHVEQLGLYAWLLNEAGYSPPHAGRLVYITMAEIRSFDVAMPTREELIEMTAAIVKKAALIVEGGRDGPPGDPKEAWECKYCPFSKGCAFAANTKTKTVVDPPPSGDAHHMSGGRGDP